MTVSTANWDEATDVLVVGSGAGALTAAIAAQSGGAQVVVIEKSDQFGGTSAMSGAGIWIPCSTQARQAGAQDTPEEAFQYIRALAAKNIPDDLIWSYVRNASRMLDWLEANSEVRYVSVPYTDYHAELPGGKLGFRTHMPVELDGRPYTRIIDELRPPSRAACFMNHMNWSLAEAFILLNQPKGWWKTVLKIFFRYYGDIGQRLRSRKDRFLALGNATMARLRISVDRRGIPVRLNSKLVELVREGDRVTGAVVERQGQRIRVQTRRGVILAAGGFERNAELRRQAMPDHPDTTTTGAHPYNTGDAILAAQKVGAATRNMNMAWWAPVFKIPGEESARLSTYERAMPGSFIVGPNGKRYHNEAASYHVSGRKMIEAGATKSWMIFDARFRAHYPVGPLLPGVPDWFHSKEILSILHKADTIEELAGKIGVPPQNLRATLERFNRDAANGRDTEFGRGDAAYDRLYGDPKVTPNPNLHPLAQAPYFAFPIYAGDIGTNGGIVIDGHGQVLDANDQPIPGLYATGNCTASVMGGAYPGAGSTLGPAMTFGYLAGFHVNGAAEAAESGGAQRCPFSGALITSAA